MKHDNAICRRDLLKKAAAGAAIAAVGPDLARSAAKAKNNRKPNILVIMSDEHNAGVTGCYGNKIIRTPNLDKLARRGVTFDSNYTNSPLCVPSRLSFTTGKYISRVGAWSNNCWLADADCPTLPKIMNTAGYDSLLCGKQHYDRTRRYGFKEIGGNMNRSFKTGTGGRRKADDTSINTRSRDRRFSKFHPGSNSGVLNHDRAVTKGVVEFLKDRKPDDKPFFLFTGFLAPHFPLIVAQKYWDIYRGKVPMPKIPPGHLDELPLNYKHLRRGFGVVETDPKIVRKGRELYYGFTQWLDKKIGEVLDALEESGHAENTVIVYTSDHGEDMGEHGLWWKNCMYEHAARVPLIVSWPARWAGGQRRTQACSLVDLVQTIAEIGEADVPDDWNGDSLCEWLDDSDAQWKDMAVSEYYAHNIASGFAMLRLGRYKYVYHNAPDEDHPEEYELYDLQADPGEFNNLAAKPEQRERIEKMHKILIEEIGEEPRETEKRCRADYAKGYGRKRNKKK